MLRLALFLTALALTAAAEPPLVTVTAETVWDIPGETGQYLLGGLLVDAGWDLRGNLCFVDYKNRDLKLFSADGRFLRTLGREGEGPGEVTDARLLLRHEDGRLGLLQKFPAKVVWLEPDGDPGGELALVNTLDGPAGQGYLSLPHAVQYPGGLMGYLAVMSLTSAGPTEHHWIAPINADGTVGKPLWQREEPQAAARPDGRIHEADLYYLWAARWAPDGHGGAWLAPERDRYRIVHLAADGAELQVLERPYTAPDRDDLGRYQAREQLVRKRIPRDRLVLADHDPVVGRLRRSDENLLWVDLSLGGRGPEPGTIAELDVWSRDGRWLARRRLVGDFDPNLDQRLFLDDRHVLVLRATDAGEVRLRLLRLTEPDR
ncbi:MAG: hypothetical protein R3D98_00840 [Candidatus Krumholzibacteriia bacterium]